jgi:hypothetical protein
MSTKTKLNQVVAVVTGQKPETEKALTEAYHALQKPELFTGLSRTYTPRSDDDRDAKPPESKRPQRNIREMFASLVPVLTKTWNSVATQDWGNCEARASVTVDGQTILSQVPVPHLLFLEHKLSEMKAFVEKMPVRDGAEEWNFSPDANCFTTNPIRRESTRKVTKPIVLYQATDKHPAQTQLIQEDEVVGHWNEKRFSTAVSAQEKEEMLRRVAALTDAVKVAREEANSIVVERKEVAAPILDFLFKGILQ